MSPGGSAGRAGDYQGSALPFPFYDVLDWVFEPAESSLARRRALLAAKRQRTARHLFGVACHIAGPERRALHRDWSAVLAEPPQPDTVRRAAGMVLAALRLRGDDVVERCWWPVDRVLRSRVLSNVVVAVPTAAAAWILFRAQGEVGAIGHTESIAAVAAALRALVAVGRWWRRVEPPEREERARRR